MGLVSVKARREGFAAPAGRTEPDFPNWATRFASNPAFLALACAAFIYAFLAAFYTLTSFDLGWQLATGRWIAHHHSIPSTDVFSYTAQGQPWIYPAGSGLIFYGAFLLGGYPLLTWLGAVACVGTVALLLRRGSEVSAAIVILAVPLIAARTSPRADMFTVVLFAAFLTVLWEQWETGRGKLWILPVLMAAWVNLHLGFVAGIALLLVYLGAELLRMMFAESRPLAAQRLRTVWPWLVATVLATLVNPWGWTLYKALVRQEGLMGLHSERITEWVSMPMTRTALLKAFLFRQPDGAFYALLLVAIVAAVIAAVRKQFPVAIFIAGAAWLGAHHLRFQALFACILVVVGGSILASALAALREHIPDKKLCSILVFGAAALFMLLMAIRSADLITNRYYFGSSGERRSFGTGLSWWFPEKAAAFIEREKIPGRIFNSYDEGGFLVWRLGEQYQDWIDGRAVPFGQEIFARETQLMQSPPDSAEWQREADRFHISTILVSLARYDGLENFPVLRQFCASQDWRPVYLDEISAVFVRNLPETQALIQRAGLDCGTAPFPQNPSTNRAVAFNQWSNAAAVLYTLGRNDEAFTAATNALNIFPESSVPRLIRGRVLLTIGRPEDAEAELRAATRVEDNPAVWFSLARMYRMENRLPEAIHAAKKSAAFSPQPFGMLLALGHLYLEAHDPKSALEALDQASAAAPRNSDSAPLRQSLADLAQCRALAWRELGDLGRATSAQEEAVALAPDVRQYWTQLADLYGAQGRKREAEQARQRAEAVNSK